MIGSINSIQTLTSIPSGLLRREQRKVYQNCRFCFSNPYPLKNFSALVAKTMYGDIRRREIMCNGNQQVLQDQKNLFKRNVSSVRNMKKKFMVKVSPKISTANLIVVGEMQHKKIVLPEAFSQQPKPEQLYFFRLNHCHITLPHSMKSLRLRGAEAKRLTVSMNQTLTPKLVNALHYLSARIRERHKQRAFIRSLEFKAWYTDNRKDRCTLLILSFLTLGIFVLLTFMCCVLVSASLTFDEAVRWTAVVCESILIQALLSDPLFVLVFFSFRLMLGWILLQKFRRKHAASYGKHTLQHVASVSDVGSVLNGENQNCKRTSACEYAAVRAFQIN
jgi:hypothetical protein